MAEGVDAPAVSDLPLLLVLGLSATLAQLAMTRAYGRGRTLVAGCLSYSTLLFSALAGALVLGEMPGVLAWLGMALIVLAGVASMTTPAPSAPTNPPEPLAEPPNTTGGTVRP